MLLVAYKLMVVALVVMNVQQVLPLMVNLHLVQLVYLVVEVEDLVIPLIREEVTEIMVVQDLKVLMFVLAAVVVPVELVKIVMVQHLKEDMVD